MTETPTSTPEIDRLRSDLDTIQAAIGSGLPFGKADIRFCWAMIVAIVLYLVLHAQGMSSGWLQLAAAAPLLGLLGAYLVYMAIKSRRQSGSAPVVRKEYRLVVAITALIAITLPLAKKWAIAQGLDLRTFDSIAVIMLGVATLAITLMPFATATTFRRLSIGIAGLGLIIIGLLLPTVSRELRTPVIGAILIGVLVCQALLMQYFLRRESSGSDLASAHGQ